MGLAEWESKAAFFCANNGINVTKPPICRNVICYSQPEQQTHCPPSTLNVFIFWKSMLICSVKNGSGLSGDWESPSEITSPLGGKQEDTFILCTETHWLYWSCVFAQTQFQEAPLSFWWTFPVLLLYMTKEAVLYMTAL